MEGIQYELIKEDLTIADYRDIIQVGHFLLPKPHLIMSERLKQHFGEVTQVGYDYLYRMNFYGREEHISYSINQYSLYKKGKETEDDLFLKELFIND